jgi:hypothetical protein
LCLHNEANLATMPHAEVGVGNVGGLTSETTTRIRRAVASRVEIREWYVCTRGSEPVGPVSTELIARGIVAGKVPRDALIARIGDSVWQRVMRVPEVTSALELLSLQGPPAP